MDLDCGSLMPICAKLRDVALRASLKKTTFHIRQQDGGSLKRQQAAAVQGGLRHN